MLMAAGGAALVVLGRILGVIDYATLSLTEPGRFTDLAHAGAWLGFVGWLVALCGVAIVGWQLLVSRDTSGAAEVGAVALGALMITIGLLVTAVSLISDTGSVLEAIGLGVWGLLAFVTAARRGQVLAPGGQQQIASDTQVPRWIISGVALVVLAVGTGLTYEVSGQGRSIAYGVMLAIGAGVLAVVVALAREVEFVKASSVVWVVVALALSAVFGIAAAVVAGVDFSSTGTLTGLRVGVSITFALSALSYAAFAIAAYVRAQEVASLPPLSSRVGRTSSQPSTYGEPPPIPPPPGQRIPNATPTTEPNVPPQQLRAQRFCTQCGAELTAEARFCQRCGTQVQ
jgi:hypothetical protein